MVNNQLLIKPSESIVSRDQFKPFIALCTGEFNTHVVGWRSPSLMTIEENSQSRITVERKPAGLRLRIRNLTQDDQGVWKCLGLDRNGKSIDETIEINVKIPITFVSQSIQYAQLDSTVLIKCQVIANPTAEISWFKGQNKMNILSSNYDQRSDGLRIRRVSSVDNDTFWCQADVIETGESKDYQIQILIAQTITSVKIRCLEPCAVEKRATTLICEADGTPSPQFSWFYGQNDPLLINGVSKYIVRENRLIINYVDETDNGQYICHAFNDYDKTGKKAEYMLNVVVPPFVSPILPKEIHIGHNLLSQEASFACQVLRGSIENLSLEWVYANKTPVQPINGISIDRSQLKTQRLIEIHFDPVKREHHGNYTCLAKNSADVVSTVAQLLVHYKPILVEPKMIDVYSVPNHPAIMICEFDSYPAPIIQWIKILEESYTNKQIILNNNDPQVIEISTEQIDSTRYQTKLTYDPLEKDFNINFQCHADNSLVEKHTINLRRAKPPQPVHIIEPEPSSDTVAIDVQPPSDFGGLPLLNYIVKYEEINVENSQQNLSIPVLTNDSQILYIKSLRVGTSYRFQIAVESHAGQSPFSNPVIIDTLTGDTPQFRLLNISCSNNKFYVVEWFIDNDGGTPISKSEISYGVINHDNKTKKWYGPFATEQKTTKYELKGLKQNKNYSISVRLYNKAGSNAQNIIKTIGSNYQCKRHYKGGPSIWYSIGIIVFIIFVFLILFSLLIFYRTCCKANNTPQSAEQERLRSSD